MVAPITSTRRGAPSEVPLGVNEGLKDNSAVNLDHVQTVERTRLVSFVGSLDAAQMRHVCRALAVATGCSDQAEHLIQAELVRVVTLEAFIRIANNGQL